MQGIEMKKAADNSWHNFANYCPRKYSNLGSDSQISLRRLDISLSDRFVVTMVYYGVSFSAGAFGGNRYLVFFLTSLIEIPSNYTAIVACKK